LDTDAARGGGAAASSGSSAGVLSRSSVTIEEASKILNVPKDATREAVEKVRLAP